MFEEKPILIVEDEALIAMCLADIVTELLGEVVGPVGTVADALSLMDTTPVEGAILDAMLLDRDITPVALRLAEAGIPFVVHTATGLPTAVAQMWPEIPVLIKPVPAVDVVERLWLEIQLKAQAR